MNMWHEPDGVPIHDPEMTSIAFLSSMWIEILSWDTAPQLNFNDRQVK